MDFWLGLGKPYRHTETLGSSLSSKMLALPLPLLCFDGLMLLLGNLLIFRLVKFFYNGFKRLVLIEGNMCDY